MRLIGFLLRAAKLEWKSALKHWCTTSLQKPKAVYAANEQQYIAACGDLLVPYVGIHEWRKAEQKTYTRIGKAKAVLREFYRSAVTKPEFSNTTKLAVFKSVFVPIVTYGHESWVMTGRMLPQVQAAEMGFCEECAVCHLATKCAFVKSVNHWMSSHFLESSDSSYVGSAGCPDCPRKDWRASPAGYIHGKAAQTASNDPVQWLQLWLCLILSWCGSSRTAVYDIAVERELFRVLLGVLPPQLAWEEKWA